MESFLKNIKLKTVLIFLIPAIGLLYFSSSYVYRNYKLYTKSLYLEHSIHYVQKMMAVVRSLQKERGLSVACLNSTLFCDMLKKQRKKSDDTVKKLTDFLLKHKDHFDISFQHTLTNIVKDLDRLTVLRNRFDKKQLGTIEVLDSYSVVIEELINSSSSLEQRFIDDNFFKTILSFNKILWLAEINGRERALIAYLIKNKKFDVQIIKQILKLQIEADSVHKLLDKIMPLEVEILYKKFLPKSIELDFTNLKKTIIEQKDFSSFDKQFWWQKATDYIDRLFKIDNEILKIILQKKEFLKKEAFKSLLVSLTLWTASILALLLFVRLFTKLLNDFIHYIKMVEYEKKFYQVFSEFSEDVMFLEDETSLLHSFILYIKLFEL